MEVRRFDFRNEAVDWEFVGSKIAQAALSPEVVAAIKTELQTPEQVERFSFRTFGLQRRLWAATNKHTTARLVLSINSHATHATSLQVRMVVQTVDTCVSFLQASVGSTFAQFTDEMGQKLLAEWVGEVPWMAANDACLTATTHCCFFVDKLLWGRGGAALGL